MGTNALMDSTTAVDDAALVARAQDGSQDALEALVKQHQAWIYNIALRMVYLPQDAEDITQEILIKLITKLSTFEGRSAFRTWLYRIVVNHVLNMKRTRAEEAAWTFERYGSSLDGAPDEELPDQNTVPVDVALLIEEAKIGCTTGMLLCLSREQRLVYVLGEIFGVTDVVGAEFFEISRDAFRQKLARARRDLHQFMGGQCGLINEANPCRCARKTQSFMKAGYVDPKKLLFARAHVTRVRELAPKTLAHLETLDEDYAEIHRDHPFQKGPDFVASLRKLMSGLAMVLLASVVSLGGSACSRAPESTTSPDEIIALEKGALDRWSKGDPQGFYEIMAVGITYFDPLTEKRVDGLEAIKTYFAPFAFKFSIERIEMVNPQVEFGGDVAVLSFNLVNHGIQMNGGPKGTSRWNSTEIYRRLDGKWKIIHSHWSYTKPELKAQAAPA
jgi:RNA polymerase sigma factor (sigma-70 family)